MASKIYKKGVFLVIEDTVSGNLKEFNTADVQIVKRNSSLDQYEVLVLGVSQLKVNLADIKDEAGSAYSENDWDVFRFNSVGVTSQGGSAASGVSYDGTTSGLAATDVQAAIDEVQANVDAFPAAPTTTVVNISSAQILAMGTTPIELLPAPGAGMYYDIEKIVLEYTHVTTAYTNGTISFYKIEESGATNFIGLSGSLLEEANDSIYIPFVSVSQHANANDWNVNGTLYTNSSYRLTTNDSSNPTLGDGTLRAIITYTTRTFGA